MRLGVILPDRREAGEDQPSMLLCWIDKKELIYLNRHRAKPARLFDMTRRFLVIARYKMTNSKKLPIILLFLCDLALALFPLLLLGR